MILIIFLFYTIWLVLRDDSLFTGSAYGLGVDLFGLLDSMEIAKTPDFDVPKTLDIQFRA
jgi:hypothetical protein